MVLRGLHSVFVISSTPLIRPVPRDCCRAEWGDIRSICLRPQDIFFFHRGTKRCQGRQFSICRCTAYDVHVLYHEHFFVYFSRSLFPMPAPTSATCSIPLKLSRLQRHNNNAWPILPSTAYTSSVQAQAFPGNFYLRNTMCFSLCIFKAAKLLPYARSRPRLPVSVAGPPRQETLTGFR
jgi:hypothetical protein